MSIKELKKKKLEAIRRNLEQCQGFDFAEGLKEAFQIDGKKYKVETPRIKRHEPVLLKPVIIVRDSIRPIMTRQGSDEVMTEAAAAGEEEETMEQENLEDIAALLDSVHIFTSSSSQIPTQQKSLVLQDLVKLSLPNLKAATASIDFDLWPSDIIADLYKEITTTVNMPVANSALLVYATAYKKIAGLTATAPRLLMNSIISLARDEGKSVLDGLIIPLLFESILARPHLEVIMKTTSESLSPAQRLQLLQVILSDGELYFSNNETLIPSSSNYRKYLRPWDDSIFQIMNSILSTQPLVTLNKTCLFDLVRPIQTVVQSTPKDKGSMQLLLVLTSKYAQTLVECNALDLIEDICQTSTMFLKRSVSGQIASIKKNLSSLQQQQQ